MNRNEFNRFVAGIDLPGPGDIEGLRELTALFPWFHSAHLVLLKGLRANSDIRFDSQLKASALSVSDREVLYHYLFLSPAEAAAEPDNQASEEVDAPVAEITIPQEVSVSEAELSVTVEGEISPEDEVSAQVAEVTFQEEGEISPEDEVSAQVAEVAFQEEEEISGVTEVAHGEPDDITETVEIPAEDEVVLMPEEAKEVLTAEEAAEMSPPEEEEEISTQEEAAEMSPPEEEAEIITQEKTVEVLPPEEEEEISTQEEAAEMSPPEEEEEIITQQKTSEVLPPEEEEGVLSPDEAAEIAGSVETDGILVSGEPEIRDETQAEELPVPELSEAYADANSHLRTREELVAEIEARLEELESYRNVTPEEQEPVVVDEVVPSAEPESEHLLMPEPEPGLDAEPEPGPSPGHEIVPEPEIEVSLVSASEPEIEEPSVSASEPEIEEPSVSASEPEIEEPPVPDPSELLELIPDTVAELETQEEKLSPADLIDRFIMINPSIERRSTKEYQPLQDLTEQESDEPGKFITETLAKIYVNQGYYTRAINIYEKLTLQYPEKSAYFASRIEKIKDLIK